jgi:ribosomal protein S18 acetylase RimI-like enzyme
MIDLLDNPAWHALCGPQRPWAIRKGKACRFTSETAPFFAIHDTTAEAYADLGDILGDAPEARLFRARAEAVPAGWTKTRDRPILQMVLPADAATDLDAAMMPALTALGADDAGDMLCLAERCKPGPFAARTRELGTYLGIRVNGRLAAMAGERFRLPGYSEISAVATDPDFRGRGYGRLLTAALAARQRTRNETPFLHVFPDNLAAIGLYRAMGFQERTLLRIVWLARAW